MDYGAAMVSPNRIQGYLFQICSSSECVWKDKYTKFRHIFVIFAVEIDNNSMNSTILDKDAIPQPELWKLALNIASDHIDVGLYPPLAREEMVWRTFPFDAATGNQLRCIEDIIYDNPLLLSDFKKVDCIIDNVPAITIPEEADAAAAAMIYDDMTVSDAPGELSADDIELYPTGTDNARIAIVQDADIRAFLSRTFYNATFDSSTAALCRYFAGRPDAPVSTAVYAPVCGNTLTLIALRGKQLLMANSFRFEKEIDAAYYILASMQQLGLDLTATPVYVRTSTADAPSELQEILSRYLPSVAPIPFPTLRYRATKSTLLAPLALTIRPLCE